MKLEILQENLNKALSIISRTVVNRPQVPILSHVLLSVDNNLFTLTASNSEMTVVVPVGAKVSANGAFTVPAKTFQDLIASLSSGKISLELVSNQLKISSANFSGKINGTPASEYPSVAQPGEIRHFWEINASSLVDGIGKTLFSAASDDSRAVLTGVLFKPVKDVLFLVSTDGFRLSKIEMSGVSSSSVVADAAILPAKTLFEISKLLSEKSEGSQPKVKINFLDSNQVQFNIGDIIIYSRLITGNFPEFEKIIPSESMIQVALSSEELLKAVRSSSIFARDSANIVRLTVKNSEITISANAAEVGENETVVDVEVRKGGDTNFQIAFNYRYLLDFIGSLGSDTKITIDLNTSLAPGVFRAEKISNYLHMIMPVRVQT